MFKSALVKASEVSGMEFYTDPCIMNDKMKVVSVCQGKTPEGLTSEQVNQIKQQKCKDGKEPKVSASDIKFYCMNILSGFTKEEAVADMKKDNPDLTVADFSGITCPEIEPNPEL